MKALVTGGNGFLGSALVRMLAARGDRVATFSRSAVGMAQVQPHRTWGHESPTSAIPHSSFSIQHFQGVAQVQPHRTWGHESPTSAIPHSSFHIPHFAGDVRDPAALQRACTGMDAVFHVAAMTGIWGKSRDFHSINVVGTQNVINACISANVPKLIYTSSPSVVSRKNHLCGVDESEPYPEKYLAEYPRTKAQAEQLVLDSNCSLLSTVALRPHLIWGPGDTNLIPRVIDRARRGRLRQVGDGSNLVDLTYIDNAAEAHLLAADALSPGASCAGKAYFISQAEPVRLWEWIDQLLAAIGAPRVRKRISFGMAWCFGACSEIAYRLLAVKTEPLMTRFLANQLAKSHYFNISAAKRDLGYTPRVSSEEGMKRLVEWLTSFPDR